MIFPPPASRTDDAARRRRRARERRLDSPDRDASRAALAMLPSSRLARLPPDPLTFPPPRSRSLNISRTMDDEDPVDNRPDLEEACKPKCAKFVTAYEGCVGRVEKDTTGEAHCTGQYFDMWGASTSASPPTCSSTPSEGGKAARRGATRRVARRDFRFFRRERL